MLKLSTHIPIQYIKDNERLQGVKTEKLHYFNAGEWTGTYVDAEFYEDSSEDFRKAKLLSAPTIADIINNAEELFGEEFVDDSYETSCSAFAFHPHAIIDMCQQNKSINEIADYIVANLLK